MADLIDRQKAIDEILRLTSYDTVRSLYEATVANKYEDCYEDGVMDAIDVIIGLTSAQPEITLESAIDYLHSIGWMQEHDKALTERKTGRWIKDSLVCTSGCSYGVLRCSECDDYYESFVLWPHRYCPSCGAKMEDSDG